MAQWDKEYRAQYQRELRQIRKQAGLCTRCGQKDAIPGMTLCRVCRLKNNVSRSKNILKPREWLIQEAEAWI